MKASRHLKTTNLGEMKVNSQRSLLHTRDVAPFSQLIEVGGMPFIPSFCDISLGESIFRDARSYFNSVKSPSQLSAQQKIDTARHMHFGYNASKQQLRRMLRMDLSILEELFPELSHRHL